MTRIKQLLLLVCLTACFTACKKNDFEEFDFDGQFKKDTAAISAFVKDNNITGGTMDPVYGIYYKIIEPGVGNISYTRATTIKASYVGRLLNGTLFGDTKGVPATFMLGETIGGWFWGIQKIQKGGQIRLIIPSGYAYGDQANGPIPANSILDFTISLVDVTN